MTREQFQQHIKDADFKTLFNSLGWDNFKGNAEFEEEIDGYTYQFRTIAKKQGYQVIVCDNAQRVSASFCKRLDHKIRPNAQDYICIFTLPKEGNALHHIWAVPIRKTDKRDIVLVEYYNVGQTELLYQKIDKITFPLALNLDVVDIRDQVYSAFDVNSEKLTKDFYTGFQKQHTNFCSFITGIDDQIKDKDNKNKQWYTSVMLNRLMFCYFIQKKGFLNNDKDYLQGRLAWCQMQRGQDHFYDFYRSFLLRLFFDGINTPRHSSEFENEFGRIPYLNGGMFDKHQLEKDYDNIDIKDEAFKQLFDFFDKWEWHLDTRVTASGRDINPDVLGYIFEQYINDRAQMGAYYTKEDITEYIGKNCILPFLMDRMKETDAAAFQPDGFVWSTLQGSGSEYIYDAVKKGADQFESIPQEVAIGLDTTQPNLLERRAHWNDKTPEQWALPTEIWRETIERLQRCQDIQQKISSGEITEINDFITYNLDIRRFVQDLLEKTEDHKFILHFVKSLKSVTILDPTCGSGAFLFAAMNILEPLYEACVYRMREFHEQDENLFVDELKDLDTKYRSNVQYYIYKNIILHNLYGVDIMHEATEIAKLRLFLKMVAVVDVDMTAENLGLDPLPDIDFNIRCGNTLVGYATEQQLNDDLSYGDMFANMEFREKIEMEMDKVARTFNSFRALQLSQDASDMQAFKTAKKELEERLGKLNDLLNHRLYQSSTGGSGKTYEQWLTDTQPFHWLAEYYNIIHGNGGFDVIIGNPPYLEANQINYNVGRLYKTLDSNAVHAYCIERSLSISKGNISMIVPLALTCTQRMVNVQKILEQNRNVWYSNYAWRPAKLFDAVNRALSIFIANTKNKEQNKCFTTEYIKWISDNRVLLMCQLSYLEYNDIRTSFWMPKLHSKIEIQILRKIQNQKHTLNRYVLSVGNAKLYYRTTGGLYWKVFTNFSPKFYSNGVEGKSSRETSINIENQDSALSLVAFFTSDIFWWWYTITSNLRDLNPSDLYGIHIPEISITSNELHLLGSKLLDDIKFNSTLLTREQKNKGTTQTQSFKISKSKPIIDEIDKVLAKHYGFTEEELDFIINYDIKYRMGDELNEE